MMGSHYLHEGSDDFGFGRLLAYRELEPFDHSGGQSRLVQRLERGGGCPRVSPQTLHKTGRRQSYEPDFAGIGAGRLQTSTLRRRINQRDWAGAANELRRWVYGGGKVLPGLVTRRDAERALVLSDSPREG